MGSAGENRLSHWAEQHHGLYRSEDALRYGLSRRQVAYRVQQGRVQRVGTGVYRIVGSANSRDQRILAAVWRARGQAAFRTGAEMVGMIDVSRGRPHVLVERTQGHVHDDAIVHRTQDLLPTDVTTVRNIPVTTPTRTLVDIGLTVSDLDLEKMLHQAIHRRLTTLDRVAATYARVSRRGRHGAGPIGELLKIYGVSAAAESALEVVIIELLRHHGVREPVRQHPVCVDGEDFRLDLAYPEHQLFLEGDGFGVHGGPTKFEEDRWRQNLLVSIGWWPLRITWRQAHRQAAECASIVQRKLDDIERGRR